jgi:hypothetical protein
MRAVEERDLVHLKHLLEKGMPPDQAIGSAVGSTSLAGGAWRIFPEGDVAAWNDSDWKHAWRGLTDDFYAFGEDVFGNQLVLRADVPNVLLWDHETGEFHDLYLDVAPLLETVMASGVGWVEPYHDDSLAVATPSVAGLSPEMHLHWVQPLVLNGKVEAANLAPIARGRHLLGHAGLWRQIRDAPAGTTIVVR